MDLELLELELQTYIDNLKGEVEGERLYTAYQRVTAYALRLTEIHNQIAELEYRGKAPQELKKFRTMVLDPTIERFDKIATFESRKITARRIELDLER